MRTPLNTCTMAQELSLAFHTIYMVIHVRVFSSLGPSPFTSSSSCRPCSSSCSSCSPTRSSWQTCTTPLRRVWTPTTSSPSPQKETLFIFQAYRFDNNVPNHSLVQKRLSIYVWKPGPRRGKGALEKEITGTWHVITFQEAIEYVDHDILTNRFHVTHYGGCAILFNKDTFSPTSMSSPSTFMTQGETCLIR